ncbi:hypothetical protein CAEBREN_31508 [Caenorhabditis brenneri]|uniref:CUB-like domain-containing protein n=1 Tax=Caenorhabditis brenneri TaxID=135651 RepID=G0NJE1_CAEBE|nr:hypothetical protein CAEBREN_31508 [Caenorhabditis brenneri]
MFSLVDPNQNYLLRQSAVFAGDTFGTNFVGTLETITSSGYSLTTPFNRLSVYTFGLSNIFNYPLYMAQDLQNLRKYSEFRGANCPESGYCKITWDGIYFDEMVVTSYDGTETITTFAEVFDRDTCVNVYENRDSNSTWIAQLKSDNYLQQLPLKVNGNLKFYQYFGQRKMTMYVTRDSSN